MNEPAKEHGPHGGPHVEFRRGRLDGGDQRVVLGPHQAPAAAEAVHQGRQLERDGVRVPRRPALRSALCVL